MASKGDTFSAISSVDNNSYLDIIPAASTNEAIIHNIYHAGTIELYFYDGTNSLLFMTSSGTAVDAYLSFHVTYTIRVRAKNTSGGAILIGYDGIYIK